MILSWDQQDLNERVSLRTCCGPAGTPTSLQPSFTRARGQESREWLNDAIEDAWAP